MVELIRFRPQSELDAEENLQDFIAFCRNQLTIFGPDLPFDDNVWDLSNFVQRPGKSAQTRLYFSQVTMSRGGRGEALAEPFCSFAKAYLRHEFACRGKSCLDVGISALRALYKSLIQQGETLSVTKVSSETLNRTLPILQQSNPLSASVVACELQKLAAFLVKNHLVAVPFDWVNPLPTGICYRAGVGKEFEELRARKLPSPAALAAIAQIFRQAKEPGDVLVSSVLAILCAAPSRIGEVFRLPAHCEVIQTDSAGRGVYGLRWYPEKGAPPQTKPIVSSMVDVVKEALEKIRALTAPGRTVAAWYEQHPRELYLPRSLEHLRNQRTLEIEEIGDIVFANPVTRHALNKWLSRNSIRGENRAGTGIVAKYSFASIEAVILDMLPRGFPFVHREIKLKYSEALFCHMRGLREWTRPTYLGAIEIMGATNVVSSLTTHKRPLFERFGYLEKDGSPIRLRSHQLRHYLNTLAQAGGLSQMDIALWSGRSNIRQNSVYDHVSDRDALAFLEENTRNDKHLLPALTEKRKAVLIKRDEFERLQVKTAHTTEFGFCIHDFAMLPCQLHRDCLNCDEHLCVKGDRVRNLNLRQWRAETQKLLAQSEDARSQGFEGADRWTEHQRRTLARVEQILEVFDDRAVPDGAVIQPALGSLPSAILGTQAPHRLLGRMEETFDAT